MKFLITPLIVLLSVQFVFPQKIDKQELEFSYNRMPLKPLDKSIKNYFSEAVLQYEPEIAEAKKKAEDDYQNALVQYAKDTMQWRIDKKAAEDKYEAEKKAYDEKSFGKKFAEKNILEESTKPVLHVPSAPSKPVKDEPFLQKLFNKDVLTASYLKLEGYTKNKDNAVLITATLHGFESREPELKSAEQSKYNTSTKTTTTVKTSWYEIAYRHPVTLKVQLPTGEVIYDEIPEKLNEYQIAKTNAVEGSTPYFNENEFLAGLQDKIIEQNMKYTNELLNSNYGYSKIKRNTVIFRVEPKKFNYDDYQQAFEAAAAGYNLLSSDYAGAVEKIKAATDLWEKAAVEYKPEVKGRIDSDIALATHFNLAEAYTWMSDFPKAEAHLNKITGLKPSKKEEEKLEVFREVLKDQKTRWAANNP